MDDIDTSALADDPIMQRAQQCYEESPFTTRRWDEIEAEARRYWVEKGAAAWLAGDS